MMDIKIECVCCRECFSIQDIKIKTEARNSFDSIEEYKEWAEKSGAYFDCPECEERMYFSDCEVY